MARKLVASLFIIGLTAAVGCHAEFTAATGQPTTPATSGSAPAAPVETAVPTATATATATATPAVAPSTVKQEGNKLTLPGAIVFETGKAVIKTESEPVLEQLHAFLEGKKQITLVRIEGHTDNVGKPADNLKLSGDRALAVKNWLVNKGVDGKRLISVGFGDTKPVADNAKEEGRAQNRRTEFIVVEVGSKAWMGADPIGGGTVFGDNPRK